MDVGGLGSQLRAKAIAELDCKKIAEELSGMYSNIRRAERRSQVEKESIVCKKPNSR